MAKFESTVLGGAPVFSVFRETFPLAELSSIKGIFNATNNIINGDQTWNVPAGLNLRLATNGTAAANANLDGSGIVTVTGGGITVSPRHRTTARSMAFSSSRTLPGQR